MSGRRSDWMAVAGILGGAAVGAMATWWLSQPSPTMHVAEVADQVECRVDIVKPRIVMTSKANPKVTIYRGEQGVHDDLPALRARIESEVAENTFTITRINNEDGHVFVETSGEGEDGTHIVFLADGDEDHHVIEQNVEVKRHVEVGRHVECAEAADVEVEVDLDVAEITREARERQREQLDRARAEIERAREQVERRREEMERRREDLERVREGMTDAESVQAAEIAARLQEAMQRLNLEEGDLEVRLERDLQEALRQIELQFEEERKKRKRRPSDGGGF